MTWIHTLLGAARRAVARALHTFRQPDPEPRASDHDTPDPPSCPDAPPLVALLWLPLADMAGGDVVLVVDDAPEPRLVRLAVGVPSPVRQNAVLLDQFEQLYRRAESTGRQLDLWLGCRRVREELRQATRSFPLLLLRERPTYDHIRLRRLAEQQLRPPKTQPILPSPSPPVLSARLQVATDASVRNHIRGMGIACISTDGVWAQEYVARSIVPTHGEILAIELALRTFPDRPLTIVTDSKFAIQAIDEGISGGVSRAVSGAITTIREAAKTGVLRLHWVKGHEGHPLNEAADRLARAARRGAQLGQPATVRAQIAAGIASELAGSAHTAA